jgi:D-alanyl-D-alanine carboxypeptidase/D-alanyl-D-alanine-endopeptidase (penicillin-binding protein 4)
MLLALTLSVAVSAAASPLPAMTPAAVDHWLAALHQEYLTFEARLGAVARASVGTPYQDGPLGEGPEGTHDKDPLMTLKCVDCVTFVEQTVALAGATTHAGTFDLLQKIRYKDGRIDFEHRNHFMITDWIANNPWCQDLTGTLGVATESVTRTISRKGLFEKLKAPAFGVSTPDRSVTLDYVPTSAAAKAAANLPDASLVVFIGNVDWLFALHCGIFLRDADGVGQIYHASSKGGAVIHGDLAAYMEENAKRYRGFTAYKISAPAWEK